LIISECELIHIFDKKLLYLIGADVAVAPHSGDQGFWSQYQAWVLKAHQTIVNHKLDKMVNDRKQEK
jgi:hypothetical protein